MEERHRLTLGFPGDKRVVEVDLPEGEPVPWDLHTRFRFVGRRHPRLEGLAKVTGKARYTYDVYLPGMLYAAILRSPHAKARVKRIDFSAAKALPGVLAVWSVPEGSYVLYHGDEVAAVAATTYEEALDALERTQVDYEVLPHAATLAAAMAPGAPPVLAGRAARRGNVSRPRRRRWGDPDRAFREAAHVWEGTFRTQVQVHTPLEAHGYVCRWEEDGSLTVWASTQGTFAVQNELATRFGLPRNRVRVITEHMGGGFGSKLGLRIEGYICAELARRAGRPVKLMVDRKAEHLGCGNRPDSVQKMRIAVSKEGKILALRAESYGTGGIARRAGVRNTEIYAIPNGEKIHRDVLTNAGPACPFRAPGWPQGVFALESTLDMAAHLLGLDPLVFRDLNDPSPVRRAQRRLGAERIGWERRNGARKRPGPLVRGIGYAATRWPDTGRPGSTVHVEIARDGSVTVINGAQDIGTGTRTAMAVVAAEELGVPLQRVEVRLGDTRDPFGPASGGSSTAPSVMPAVRSAAYAAKHELFQLLAPELGVEPADLDVVDGKVVSRRSGQELSWEEACRRIPGEKLMGVGRRRRNFARYQPGVAGCQFAEVEVDLETGQIRVLKVVAIQDCGQPLNRLAIESQIEGGVIQGVAYALLEERIVDPKTGRVLNPDFVNYKIAGSLEVPEIEPIVFPVANGSNNLGITGVGEPPTIPTAAAIANAVFDATGVRMYELPMTPMRVLEALSRREG